mmetsp:Transcript_40170/g.61340  ORF Transcript_40170/g.61340 Transcript_40170/m.61340 type:complete len:122 (-) Transcript_40170:590-955(-)
MQRPLDDLERRGDQTAHENSVLDSSKMTGRTGEKGQVFSGRQLGEDCCESTFVRANVSMDEEKSVSDADCQAHFITHDKHPIVFTPSLDYTPKREDGGPISQFEVSSTKVRRPSYVADITL